MFNRLWTLLGPPCVNVTGLSDSGLPLGVQIVGRFGRDRPALEAALFLGARHHARYRRLTRIACRPSGKTAVRNFSRRR